MDKTDKYVNNDKINKFNVWPNYQFNPWAALWPTAIGIRDCKVLLSAKNKGYYSLNYVLDGKLTLKLDGYCEKEPKSRQMFIIPPDIPYSFVQSEGCQESKLFFLRLDGPYVEKHLLAMGFSEDNHVIEVAFAYEVENIIEEFVNLFVNYSPFSDAQAVALLYKLIPACNGSYVQKNDEKKLAHKIMNFINEELNMGFNIEEIARMFKISRHTLYQHFLREFHASPIQVLIDARLKKAKNLLKETDMTVTEIAREAGYFSLNHLIYNFNKELKMTPGEFRNRIHKQKEL